MSSAEIAFEKRIFHEQISRTWTQTLTRFNRFLRTYFFFNLFFLSLLFAELLSFLAFFALFQLSSFLAFLLSFFFLTLFSYCVLRLYLQAKKPDKLHDLCQEYLQECKKNIGYQDKIPEHNIALANALQKFAAHLHEQEYGYFSPPFLFKSLSTTLEKFSCVCFWRDLHHFKELLLRQAVEQHLHVVKAEPTNLEVHAALANAYVMLSSLYADPRKYHGFDENKWIHAERFSTKTQQLFRQTAQRAIEEFKILNAYAPDDPWVHMQLAYSYHDLQMPEEEMKEYETVLKILPEDKETLFKLGMLYFEEGKNAKGLQIYETLKRTHYKKAEHLIKFYGSKD